MAIINPGDYMGWGCPYPDCLSRGKMNFPEGFLPRHNMWCISELILPGQYEANSNEVWRCFSSKAMRPYLVNTIGATYGTGIYFFSPPREYIQLTFFYYYCRLPFLWQHYDTVMISDSNTMVLFH